MHPDWYFLKYRPSTDIKPRGDNRTSGDKDTLADGRQKQQWNDARVEFPSEYFTLT